MTGFGVGAVVVAEGRLVAEIRGVNQRFLDIRARLPRELGDLTLFAEQIARERLRRGRVELLVHIEGSIGGPLLVDKARARAAFRALGELRDELAPGSEIPLSLLAVVPDLFAPPSANELHALRDAVKAAVEQAIEAMAAMCAREGATLAADLGARSARLRGLVNDVAQRAEGGPEAIRKRLTMKIERLLAGGDLAVDMIRLETEVALLAERSDVTEEIIRLGSHLDQFAEVVASVTPEPVGRRLDFLLQEMLREANTLGAKAQDAGISQQVVAMKVELERLREQVQNVE
ncbi:MAG: YicC/YloC family endoribonuclease [Byssovorax sp.]